MVTSLTSASSFNPQANSEPDLLLIETRFLNQFKQSVAVDSDLTLKVYEANVPNPSPKITVTLTGSIPATTPPTFIERVVKSTGVYYFVRLPTADPVLGFSGGPIDAKWFAKLGGVELEPYPCIQRLNFPSTNETILFASEIKDYILSTLGAPTYSVELTDTQLSVCIDRALELYNRWLPKYDYGTLIPIAGKQRYAIPAFGRGVVDVQFVRKEGTPLVSDPLFGREYPRGQQLDFDQYRLGIGFFKDLLKVTSQDADWRWDPSEPLSLYVITQSQSYRVSYTFIRDNRLEEITPAHFQIFRRTALAYAKEILGAIRGKYDQIQAPTGGITLDGNVIRAAAEKELAEVTEDYRMLAVSLVPATQG